LCKVFGVNTAICYFGWADEKLATEKILFRLLPFWVAQYL
jgi:hypothetical protein